MSVRQPWAWAILHGKDVENRDWKGFPRDLFGQMIALHAAKGMTRTEYDEAKSFIYRVTEGRLRVPAYEDTEQLARQAVIGCFRVTDAVRQSTSPWWNGSMIGLVLSDVRAFFSPIECVGALGLWDVPPAVYDEMRQAAARGELIRV